MTNSTLALFIIACERLSESSAHELSRLTATRLVRSWYSDVDCEVAVMDSEGRIVRWVAPVAVAFAGKGGVGEVSRTIKRQFFERAWEGRLTGRDMVCLYCTPARSMCVLSPDDKLRSKSWICHLLMCPGIQ